MSNTQHKQPLFSMTDLQSIFTHFSPQDIEEFYQLYQLWSLKQKREETVAQVQVIAQQIAQNDTRLQALSPSTIAMSTLSQFRASGVEDIDLLDRMLERGDEWLDHTLQLFERCERLDMIQGNATDWCEHALEGAYEWLESMNAANEKDDSNDATDNETVAAISTTSTDQPELEIESLPEITEEDFLQKLMSEELTLSIPAITTDAERRAADNIQANIDVDHPFILEESPRNEASLSEEAQIEKHDENVEQEDYFTGYALTPASKHKEIVFAMSEAGANITAKTQEDGESTRRTSYEQAENSMLTEQDNIAQSAKKMEDSTLEAQTADGTEASSPEAFYQLSTDDNLKDSSPEDRDEPNTRGDADIATFEVVDEPDTRADTDIATIEVVDEPDTRGDTDIASLEVVDGLDTEYEVEDDKAIKRQEYTQHQPEEEMQSAQPQPEKQERAEERKTEKPPRGGGFLKFLLAKLLHRR